MPDKEEKNLEDVRESWLWKIIMKPVLALNDHAEFNHVMIIFILAILTMMMMALQTTMELRWLRACHHNNGRVRPLQLDTIYFWQQTRWNRCAKIYVMLSKLRRSLSSFKKQLTSKSYVKGLCVCPSLCCVSMCPSATKTKKTYRFHTL